jgi:hypothetical protein
MLLAQIKKYCEEQGLDCDFKMYEDLDISPIQVHRSKEEHKRAIFILASEMASMAAKRITKERSKNERREANKCNSMYLGGLSSSFSIRN